MRSIFWNHLQLLSFPLGSRMGTILFAYQDQWMSFPLGAFVIWFWLCPMVESIHKFQIVISIFLQQYGWWGPSRLQQRSSQCSISGVFGASTQLNSFKVSSFMKFYWESLSIILTFHLGRHFALFDSLIIIIIINRRCIINKEMVKRYRDYSIYIRSVFYI